MPTWMQAVKTIATETDEHGHMLRIMPGDYFQTGRQKARYLEATGAALIPASFNRAYRSAARDLSDCGIVISGVDVGSELDTRFPGVPVTRGDYTITQPRTLFWDTSYRARYELLPIGFYLLSRGWQICAPLFSYSQLAASMGTPEEREKTVAIIRDLRVPVYDTRFMFVRRCPQTEELLNLWQAEGGDKLAFMRALYTVKPIMNALPMTWQAGGK